ncbi:MAG: NAD(P)H-hydrate epimerase [Phycisphaeraceae bacterium]|nr:NAD(P)H-hydrate epimerase [Phycisphaerae bacterium]MBX3393489.1 NAD(P)H-hydrate epimerase [Phycisphaeraceae bacterium]
MGSSRFEEGGDRGGADRASQTAMIYGSSALREIDRLAVERYGIPTCLLMENAAGALAREVVRRRAGRGSSRVVALCGPGNNGGDGLAAARHLHNAGLEVVILTTPGSSQSDDARLHLHVAIAMGLEIHQVGDDGTIDGAAIDDRVGVAGAVVDALLGTGLDRLPTGAVAGMIEWCHRARSRGAVVVSADIPSGLDADSGRAPGACVRADATVTFVGLKRGFLSLEAQPLIGEVVVADIGVPRELADSLGEVGRFTSHPGVSEADPPRSTDHARRPGEVD